MASITRRTTPAGTRYDVRWRDERGHHHSKTFKTRAPADSWRRQTEREQDMGDLVTDPALRRLKVSEVAERWLAANPAKRASSTARDRAILNKHVLPVLGDRQVGQITRADVQSLVDHWRAEGLAASTIGRQYSATRAVFSYAVAADMIDRNPAEHTRVPKAALVERPSLTFDQLEAVAPGLGEHSAMLWLGATLGLRWAECAGMALDDVDGSTARVRQQVGRDGKLGPPKSSAGLRRIAVDSGLAEILADTIKRRRAAGATGVDLMFVNGAGRPLSYPNWRARTWVPACKQAGVPALRFHDLRSMAATALVAAGVDVKTAQTRLGHSTPTMTLGLYARATADADRAAADAVAARMRRA